MKERGERYNVSFIFALMVHILAFALFFVKFDNPKPAAPVQNVIHAVVMPAAVSKSEPLPPQTPIAPEPKPIEQSIQPETAKPEPSAVQEEQKRIQQQKLAAKKAEQLKQEQLRQEKLKLQKLKQEQDKQAKLLAQQAAEQKQKEEVKQQLAEQQRKEEEAKAEQEKLKKAQAQKLAKAQAEKERQEKIAKQKAEQAAQQQKALAAQKAAAELKKQLAAEAEQMAADSAEAARIQGEVDKYKSIILQAISQHWIVPDTAQKGLSCKVRIRIAPGGMVLSVKLLASSGDPALDRSAIAAVNKSSPLPVPADAAVFEQFRELDLIVKPDA